MKKDLFTEKVEKVTKKHGHKLKMMKRIQDKRENF